MPTLVPLFVPEPVVTERGLRLDADFTYEPVKLAWDARGRLLALSPLFYNYRRYDASDERTFGTFVIHVYEPDLSPAFIVESAALYDQVAQESGFRWNVMETSLVLGAEDSVAVTTRGNHAFFFDSELERRLRDWYGIVPRFAPDEMAIINGAAFTYEAEPLGDGRYLCVLGVSGTDGDSMFAPNLISISDGSALGVENRPMLDCFACLSSHIKENKPGQKAFPHVRLPGGELPKLSLAAQVQLYSPWLGQALPLGEDRFFVSLFHKLMRSGTKGRPFAFAIVDGTGTIVGEASGIDQKNESPYVEHHYRVGIDRARRTIVYKNKASFFLFDFEGTLRAKVPLDSPELKPLAAWHLGGVAPDGRVLLFNKKQHLLLAVDPVEPSVGALREALTSAASALEKQRAPLKKRFNARGAHYLHPGQVKRH